MTTSLKSKLTTTTVQTLGNRFYDWQTRSVY